MTVSAKLAGYSNWPGLAHVFRLDPERITKRKHKYETSCGLTSLTPDEAVLARLPRRSENTGVENGLHYRRDVAFHEDAPRLTMGRAGRAVVSLNKLVIGLLRLAGFDNFAAARRYCGANLDDAPATLFVSQRTWESLPFGRSPIEQMDGSVEGPGAPSGSQSPPQFGENLSPDGRMWIVSKPLSSIRIHDNVCS